MPMNELDASMIDQIAAQQLGAAPAPQGQPPVDPAAAQAAPPPPPKADPTPTATELATKKGEPKAAEGDSAIQMFEIDDDDGTKRQLTAQQIKSTFGRYKDLNHRHQTEYAPMKPVLNIAQQIMAEAKKNGYDAKPEEIAELVQAALKSHLSNPTMGSTKKGGDVQQGEKGQAQQAMSPPAEEGDNALSAWEKEHAVSLPPGYREQQGSMKAMQQQMAEMVNMMKASMLSASSGAQAERAATQATGEATQMQASAATQSIKNNMQQAMSANQIDPQAQQDVMIFAMQRGYTPEDFIDAELANTVMADYKANKDAPEINRLREIAKRRQSFTGMVEGTPGSGAGAPPAAADPMFQQLVDGAMKR